MITNVIERGRSWSQLRMHSADSTRAWVGYGSLYGAFRFWYVVLPLLTAWVLDRLAHRVLGHSRPTDALIILLVWSVIIGGGFYCWIAHVRSRQPVAQKWSTIAEEYRPFLDALSQSWRQNMIDAALVIKNVQREALSMKQARYRVDETKEQKRRRQLAELTQGAWDDYLYPTLYGAMESPLGLQLVVHMLPGQVLADYEKASERLAHIWKVLGLRVVQTSPGEVTLTLVVRDPLAQPIAMPPLPAPGSVSVLDRILVAVDETGSPIYRSVAAESTHGVRQGQTRSGKSQATYSEILQLVQMPDVLISILDPTQLLTAPFAHSVHASVQASGTADMDAYVRVLDSLTVEMQRRIDPMAPRYIDKVAEFSRDEPLIMVYLEEYPAILKAAQSFDAREGRKAGSRTYDAISASVSRLLAESAKAGFRCRLNIQRADASIVGGAERSNVADRLTLRVDNADAVRMLHEGISVDQFGLVREFPPGVGIYEAPGVPAQKVRIPYVGEYEVYARAVEAACKVVAPKLSISDEEIDAFFDQFREPGADPQ